MAKKKGAGKAAKVVDPAIAAAEEKRKEMIREADRLQKRMQFEEAEAEKMKLSYAQLARNWALDKSRVIALGDELRQKEGVVETLKDQQGAEIMELKKKLKDYLLDLHEEVVSEVIGGEELNKQAQDMQRDVRVGLRTDARGLKKTHKERELSKEELSRKLKRAHDQHSYEVRRDYERRLTEAKQQYDHDARVLREQLDLKRKKAVAALEEKKLAHTARIMREHERALKAIREYYVDVTHNNLEKIKELKGLVSARRQAEEGDLISIRKLARENKRMALPLKQANEDLYQLGEQLKEHEADKAALRTVTAQLLVVADECEKSSWERDLLTQKLERAEMDAKELQTKYLEVTASVDQKNGFERLLLERRITATKQEIDTREAQMHHVLVDVGGVQPSAVRQITTHPNPLEGVVGQLKEARRDADALDETYQAMVAAAAAKLEEFRIAPNEIGFEPRASLRALGEV